MSFKDIEIPFSITTGYQDPNNDFFSPVLSKAKKFDVAVGYFTSNWLKDVLWGIHELAVSGGRCRFIISPSLEYEDAIALIESQRKCGNDIYTNEYEEKITHEIMSLSVDTRSLLCNLICAGVFEFRVAMPKKKCCNLFHAKIGVACDFSGCELAFNGSFNLTSNAKSNWEYIDVFHSDADLARIKSIKDRFECLWNDTDQFYNVKKPSDMLLRHIREHITDDITKYNIKKDKIELREYQKEAIEKWRQNNGRGLLVMATGSGKTITALSAVKKVIDRSNKVGKPLFVVFILPLKHLLEQWHDEATKFGFDAIKCYQSGASWKNALHEKLAYQVIHKSGVVMAMVTNATLSLGNFQKVINGVSVPMMIVADEAHNLGSTNYLKSLPEKAEIRLGLTATPDRYNDPEGTKALIEYFDKIVFEFDLSDAINAGYLVQYNYHPFICEFNDEEFLEYKAVISRLADKTTSLIEAETQLEQISNCATNKFLILRREIESLLQGGGLRHTLVYCGANKDAEGSRQIEKIKRIIGSELGVRTRSFTAEESISTRNEILEQFSSGELHCLLAIKCLDEGVDVPATKRAFILSSTSNPREYIQRRGRVLRRSQEKNMADIYDFIMVPPKGETNVDMVSREVRRGLEYNSLAMNRESNRKMFEQLIFEHEVDL